MDNIVNAVAEITIGPSRFFLAPDTEPLPTIGVAGVFANWDAPGATNDGIEWDWTGTYKEIIVDEFLGMLDKKLIAQKLTMTCKMAQSTLKNFHYAIPSSTLSDDGLTLTIGSPADIPKWRLGFEGPAPNGKTRQGLIYRVTSIAAVKAHYQRKDWLNLPMQFEALTDPTQPLGSDLAIYTDF